MKKFYDMIVVMPVGPNCPMDIVSDNIDSITYYTKCSYKIVFIVEPAAAIGAEIKRKYPAVDVLYSPKRFPKNGGLYVKVAIAYRHVVENYRFDALLRMDADALIIGENPEVEAIRMFKSNPNIGIAGQYPSNYDGTPWDISWGRGEILKAISWQLIRRPRGNFSILNLYLKALKYGYTAGDFVFGGVCFLSEPFLVKMYEEGYLPSYNLGKCYLEEDHIFSLIAKAFGFGFGDLASGRLPFGCAWLTLPASPEQLRRDGKKIIHSTRSWKDIKEKQVREYFRAQRQEVSLALTKTE
ncbi:hypothetical protein GCM10027443_27650 [Pontibacter brevis]